MSRLVEDPGDGQNETLLGVCFFQFRGRGDCASQQVFQTGDEGLEHPGFQVTQLDRERQPPQGFPPELVGHAAVFHGLPAQHLRPRHQCPDAQLFQQAGFAHPALATHQPGAAPACVGFCKRVGQLCQFGIAPHETGGL